MGVAKITAPTAMRNCTMGVCSVRPSGLLPLPPSSRRRLAESITRVVDGMYSTL
jgi:hypothetical protein